MDETDRHKHTDEHPAVLTKTEARQASPRTMNFHALVAGMALATLAGAGLLVWWLWL